MGDRNRPSHRHRPNRNACDLPGRITWLERAGIEERALYKDSKPKVFSPE